MDAAPMIDVASPTLVPSTSLALSASPRSHAASVKAALAALDDTPIGERSRLSAFAAKVMPSPRGASSGSSPASEALTGTGAAVEGSAAAAVPGSSSSTTDSASRRPSGVDSEPDEAASATAVARTLAQYELLLAADEARAFRAANDGNAASRPHTAAGSTPGGPQRGSPKRRALPAKKTDPAAVKAARVQGLFVFQGHFASTRARSVNEEAAVQPPVQLRAATPECSTRDPGSLAHSPRCGPEASFAELVKDTDKEPVPRCLLCHITRQKLPTVPPRPVRVVRPLSASEQRLHELHSIVRSRRPASVASLAAPPRPVSRAYTVWSSTAGSSGPLQAEEAATPKPDAKPARDVRTPSCGPSPRQAAASRRATKTAARLMTAIGAGTAKTPARETTAVPRRSATSSGQSREAVLKRQWEDRQTRFRAANAGRFWTKANEFT